MSSIRNATARLAGPSSGALKRTMGRRAPPSRTSKSSGPRPVDRPIPRVGGDHVDPDDVRLHREHRGRLGRPRAPGLLGDETARGEGEPQQRDRGERSRHRLSMSRCAFSTKPTTRPCRSMRAARATVSSGACRERTTNTKPSKWSCSSSASASGSERRAVADHEIEDAVGGVQQGRQPVGRVRLERPLRVPRRPTGPRSRPTGGAAPAPRSCPRGTG